MQALISVVIPVLNDAAKLDACLHLLDSQSIPALEILVVDGGSTDDSLQVAKRAGARVINNPYRLAEPGVAIGVQAAQGDLVVILAADNWVRSSRFLERMAEPFAKDDSVWAAFPRVVSTGHDSVASRYINRFSDPFSQFVYGGETSLQGVRKPTSGYRVISSSVKSHPLLAAAQGCMLRRDEIRSASPEDADDILTIIDLIGRGGRIALVYDAEIEHHTVDSLKHLFQKYRARIGSARGRNQGYLVRRRYMSRARQLRSWLWFPYSVTLVLPLVHGLVLYLKHRDLVALYHPIINSAIFLAFCSALPSLLSGKLPGGVAPSLPTQPEPRLVRGPRGGG